jgi:hypothetical protein
MIDLTSPDRGEVEDIAQRVEDVADLMPVEGSDLLPV